MKIKILQFKRTYTLEKYCCACKELRLFATGTENYDTPTQNIKNMLLTYLKDENYSRLQKMGWILCGKSIIPPNFAEKELVEYARDFFKEEITNYQIVEINVGTEPGD